MLRQLKSQGKEGNRRGKNTETKQGRQRPRKRASSGESGEGGELTIGDGERTTGGDSGEKASYADAWKERRDKESKAEGNKGSRADPRPAALDSWGRPTVSKGQAEGKGGAGLEGQPRPPPSILGEPKSGALHG